MSNTFKAVHVNEIVQTVSDTHSFNADKLFAVNTSDVEEGRLLTPTLLPVEELKGQFKKSIQNGDILFSEIRPANKHFAVVNVDYPERYVASTKLMVLRKFNEEVDAKYFYYWLTNTTFLNILQRRAENRICSFPQITFELLSEYTVPVPDIATQRSVAKLLATIDSKISNNTSICSDLESMAKLLYDYWFVQFDFPDENGKPYKSSGGKMVWNEELKREIPEGWEVKKLGNIVKPAKKSKIKVGEAKKVGEYPFFTSGEKILKYDEYFVDGFNCFLNTGGNPDVKGYLGKCAYSTDTWCINADENSYILYYHLQKILPQFKLLFFTGSGLQHLQKDVFLKELIIVPSENILQKFNNTVEELWQKKTSCIQENQELISYRDFILPLLMNGQAKIESEN